MSESAPKILVTGAYGFVGSRYRALCDDWLPLPRGLDLRDPSAVSEAITGLLSCNHVRGVIHLAALSNPKLSFENVSEVWATNVLGTVNLSEALAAAGFRGRFLYVSSGSAYPAGPELITEETPVVPRSPYVASKLAGELVIEEWSRRHGLEVVFVRPFNHSGPGQTRQYFLPSMVAQVCSLPAEGGEIEVGNLNVYRDFLHVDDVIYAYRLLLERGVAGEMYNLASGQSYRLSYILDLLARKSGRSVAFRVSPSRYVADSEELLRVDLSKIVAHTGWKPERGLEDLLGDLLEEEVNKTCQREL